VQEAYTHCRKHLPHLVKVAGGERAWGTDDARAKGGDYFGASCEPRPWVTDAWDARGQLRVGCRAASEAGANVEQAGLGRSPRPPGRQVG
jgi:hypothetical protein